MLASSGRFAPEIFISKKESAVKKPAKRSSLAIEIFGWLGPVAVLLAFGLASAGIIEARSYPFQLLSLFGAISLGTISVMRRAYQPAALNIIMAVIAAVTIITLIV